MNYTLKHKDRPLLIFQMRRKEVDHAMINKQFLEYMDIQTMVDFLILNRDRHQGNIGFLRDSETMQIVCPAPIYDSGSSKHLEQELPEGVTKTKVNGLYPTEDECLEQVTCWDMLDPDKLPVVGEIREIYDQCRNISEYRKERLLDLYQKKAGYLTKYNKGD